MSDTDLPRSQYEQYREGRSSNSRWDTHEQPGEHKIASSRPSYLSFNWWQTLTSLSLVGNNIGPDGAEYIGEALKLNHVRQDSLSSSTHMSLCSSQTLTFLDLGVNGIIADGARVLADALKSNRVRWKHLYNGPNYPPTSFHNAETQLSQSRSQLHHERRSEVHCPCLEDQPSTARHQVSPLIPSIPCSIVDIDHVTPLAQRLWVWGCAVSRWCLNAQSGKMSFRLLSHARWRCLS